MDTQIIDQATAVTALRTARDRLAAAQYKANNAMETLRDLIVQLRPSGLLTVDQLAEAVGRDRNYVDRAWSKHGTGDKGKQTRVSAAGANEDDARNAVETLSGAAARQRDLAAEATVLLAERNRVVALVYASRLLGPTAIAAEVQVDRNHVLRLARRAGVAPVHRQGSRNQYSPQA